MDFDEEKIHLYAKSDIGKRRKNNEDATYCAKSQFGSILVVADGMGGYRKGEVASSLVINDLAYVFSTFKKPIQAKHIRRPIVKTMVALNKKIFKQGQIPDYERMATTTTLALVGNEDTYIFACGDSRAYTYKKGFYLKQISYDQTYVEFLKMHHREDEIKDLPIEKSHALYAGIGVLGFLDEIEEYIIKNDDYDKLLLCTDGLTNMVSDEEIQSILKVDDLSTEEKCNKLIQAALDNGGLDNVAVVILEKDNG